VREKYYWLADKQAEQSKYDFNILV